MQRRQQIGTGNRRWLNPDKTFAGQRVRPPGNLASGARK